MLMGHNLTISDYNFGIIATGYICCNCNAHVTKFNLTGDFLIWHNTNHIKMLSCDEYLIKGILE